jgi:hypothetical protein
MYGRDLFYSPIYPSPILYPIFLIKRISTRRKAFGLVGRLVGSTDPSIPRQNTAHLMFHVTAASNVLKLLPPARFAPSACSAARGMLQNFRYNNIPNP